MQSDDRLGLLNQSRDATDGFSIIAGTCFHYGMSFRDVENLETQVTITMKYSRIPFVAVLPKLYFHGAFLNTQITKYT